MINQRNSPLWFKLNGSIRYFLSHGGVPFVKYYIINEYPKSGGSWIGCMLGEVLDIPFPRNRLPIFQSSILQGHMMHSWNMRNVVIVWRDGRDVLVSQYYHWLFENDRGNTLLVKKTRSDLAFNDYENIQENLPVFMEYIYEKSAHLRFSWKDFADKWINCKSCVHLKYEGIRADPVSELRRVVSELTGDDIKKDIVEKVVSNHSFKRLSGRNSGEQNKNSFMRKGIVGDWKNHFTPIARTKFDQYAGDVLINLGYEPDKSWISDECI